MEEGLEEGRGEGRLRRVLPYVLLMLLVFGAYASSLPGIFAYDDFSTVVRNPFLKSARGMRYLFSSQYYKLFGEYSYRPLVTLTYFVDFAAWGLRPTGYHATNLAIHAVMVLLVYALVKELSGKRVAGFVGAALYAVHPVLTDAVNGISFREDLLAGVFYMGAFLLYVKGRKAGRNGLVAVSVVLFVAALLSKEIAVALPIMLLAYELAFRPGGRKSGACWVGVFFAMAICFGLLRLSVLHDPGEEPAGYPGGSFGTNVLTVGWVFARYVGLVLFPRDLSVHHYVPAVMGLGDPRAAVGIAAVVCYAGVTALSMKLDRRVGFGLVWCPVALLPVMNVIPIANIMAERYLYLPMVSYALVWGGVLVGVGKIRGWGSVVRVAALVLIPALCLATAVRNLDWSNEVRLWEKAVEVYPGSSRAHGYLGAALTREKNYAAAMAETKYALSLSTEPEANRVLVFNMSQNLRALGRVEEAIEVLKKFAEMEGGEGAFRAILAPAYLGIGDVESARAVLEEALEKDPNDFVAMEYMGLVLQREGKPEEGLEMLRRSVSIAPERGGAHAHIALLLIEGGEEAEALKELEEAGRMTVEETSVLTNIGMGYLKLNKLGEAEEYLLRALATDEGNAIAKGQLGELYFRKGIMVKAIPYLEEAVADYPEDLASLYRLGGAYIRAGEREKAKGALSRFVEEWDGDPTYTEAAKKKLDELEGKVP